MTPTPGLAPGPARTPAHPGFDPRLIGPLHGGWNHKRHGSLIIRLWRAVDLGDVEARYAAELLTSMGPLKAINALSKRGIDLNAPAYDRSPGIPADAKS